MPRRGTPTWIDIGESFIYRVENNEPDPLFHPRLVSARRRLEALADGFDPRAVDAEIIEAETAGRA
jgi:hypothetical protein